MKLRQLQKMLELILHLQNRRDRCCCYDRLSFSPEVVKEGKESFELWWDSWILPKLKELETEVCKEIRKRNKTTI
jgi:hypothetical protein